MANAEKTRIPVIMQENEHKIASIAPLRFDEFNDFYKIMRLK